MIGAARRLIAPSAVAAALEDIVVRLKDRMYRLQAALQTRLSPAPQPRLPGTPVIPMVRYRDVPAAIAWLCRAFGMKTHRIETDASGKPCYAELTIGSGMLIVAPIEDTVFGRLLVQPDEIGGVETQVCYLCVANVRAHHARARAAGAVVVIDPDHEVNKGRGYSCRDPEGHVWNFGTYDPWATRRRAAPVSPVTQGWNLRRLRHAAAAVVLLLLAGGLLLQVAPQPSARASVAASTAPAAPTSPPANTPPASPIAAPPQAEPPAATDATADDHDTEAHSLALAAAERAASEARTRLTAAQGAIAKAERDARRAEREAATARQQIDQMQRAKEAAERTAAEARANLAAAQLSAERARAEAALERARRIAAVRASLRATQRAAQQRAQPRARWARSWCYTPGVPNPASNRAGRLAGFCKS